MTHGSQKRIALLRQELLRVLDGWGVEPEDGIREDTSLIRSGLLDSLTLFNVAAWIEEKIGAPLDPGTLDLAEEWDTVTGILRFVERHRPSHLGIAEEQ
jgi:acyl carrier protein